jgi:hypothetical protein
MAREQCSPHFGRHGAVIAEQLLAVFELGRVAIPDEGTKRGDGGCHVTSE